jgi:hypothetical protein
MGCSSCIVPRSIARLGRGESGALFIEALVAITVFTLLGTAVLTGVSTTLIAAGGIDERATAENAARNQMETILASPYVEPPATVTPIAAPEGYALAAAIEEYIPGATNIALIVVTVTRNGEQVLVIESLRLKDA